MLVVDNPEWEEGIASSLRAALDALTPTPRSSAVCVGLADQPLVGPEAYRRLASAGDGELAVATLRRRTGQPGQAGA